MRNLTIERRKTGVGCLAIANVFIEDREQSEIEIDGMPLRKLGILKNGETKTFEIDEEARRIYVIADQLSKEYCNDFFDLPAGAEDVSLSGQNKLNPANGNAFRFDGNDSEAVKQNHKKGLRIGLIALIVSIVIGGVVGTAIGLLLFPKLKNQKKTFETEAFSVTLTNEFVEVDAEELESYAAFGSNEVALFFYEESMILHPILQGFTLRNYAEQKVYNQGIDDTELIETDGHVSYEYSWQDPETANENRYRVYLFKTADSFWTVIFGVNSKSFSKYEKQMDEWISTLRFKERALEAAGS
ncbi:MAG: hypothetical protein IK088_03350 [Lachnospiraceae bacterium]|nr:hypothetical protein [Lachnospiraceae bacterium]